MLRSVLISFIFGLLFAGGLANPQAEASRSIPRSPQTSILDEDAVLTPANKKALEQLLTEHYRLAGDSISFALLSSLDGEPLERFSGQVFREWKIDRTDRTNGIVFVVAWKEEKARLEVGLGHEAQLIDKSPALLEEHFVPTLKRIGPEAALITLGLELLRALESPVLSNPDTQTLLTDLDKQITAQPSSTFRAARRIGFGVFLIFGLAALSGAIYWNLHPDTHYSSQGERWLKPRFWERYTDRFSKQHDIDWGGTHGRWG